MDTALRERQPQNAMLDERAVDLASERVEVAKGVRLRVMEWLAPGVGAWILELDAGARLVHRAHVSEDRLVLSGQLAEDQQLHPEGTYTRRRKGSAGALASAAGCRVAFKARPAAPDDNRDLTLHTPRMSWLPAGEDLFTKRLYNAADSRVALLRFDPGARLESHLHREGEEFLVCRGALRDEHGHYPTGAWVRQPVGSRHAVFTAEGCVLWTIAGHLAGSARARLAPLIA